MLGCLFDVHGNLPALEAVLEDARACGVSRFVLGGDYSAFGAWPAECVETLDALDVALRIRGNWERWAHDPPPDVVADEATSAAAEAVRTALGRERVAELGALPQAVRLDSALVCHASPRSDMDGFSATAAPEEDAALLAGIDAPRLIFGHTHRQFTRVAASGQELCNPGSVGMPLHGDQRAAWAFLDDDGRVRLRRVEYDVAAAVAGLRERYGGEPWAPVIAARLESAAI